MTKLKQRNQGGEETQLSDQTPSINDTKIISNLKIVNWNVSSLKKNTLAIIKKHCPHIFCLQEVRDKQVENSVKYSYHYARQNTERSGGILVGVHKQFNSQNITNYYYPKNNQTYDILIIRIANSIIDLIIINVYFHNKQEFKSHQQNFQKSIIKIMEQISHKQLLIICGDFNYDQNPISFLNDLIPNQITFSRQNLNRTIKSKTDHILTNKKMESKTVIKWYQESDHCLIELCLQIEKINRRIDTELIYIDKQKAITECQKLQNKYPDFNQFYQTYKQKIYTKKILNKKRIRIQQIKEQQQHNSLSEQFLNLFTQDRLSFFKLLKKTIIMEKQKRDGGFFNCFLNDNQELIVGPKVFSNCFKQLDKYSLLGKYEPMMIPTLQPLTQNQIQELQKQIANDKAITYDCLTHQMIKHCKLELLKDVWKPETFSANKKLGWVRLIPLNKVHPKIPNKEQFRPLVILSPLFKFIELRFYQKLMQYMINGIKKEQTGFIKGYGTQINLLLMKDMIINFTNKDKKVIIFIDFSSAYNTIDRQYLYQLMSINQILPENEIRFLQAIHSRILYIHPHNIEKKFYYLNGVPQGSPISPLLFNIYMDNFLKNLTEKLNYKIQVLGYADDLAFILNKSHTCNFLQILIQLSQQWKLQINSKKSGKMPIKFNLKKPEIFGLPIIYKYRYLGITIDNKGKIQQHIKDLRQILNYKMHKIRQITYEMDFKQRLLMYIIFIEPYFTYCYNLSQLENKTQNQRTQLLRKKVMKFILRLPKQTSNEFLDIFLEKQNLNNKVSLQKVYKKVLDRGLEIQINILEQSDQVNITKFKNRIKVIQSLPKNLEYLFKFGWCHCNEHNDRRITFNHILEEHLGLTFQLFLDQLKLDRIDMNTNDRLEKELEKLHKQYVKTRAN